MDCQRCNGKPPLENSERSPESVNIAVVARIENLVGQIRSGCPFDFDSLSYLEWKLIEIYRSAIEQQERIIKVKTARIFEAFTQQQ